MPFDYIILAFLISFFISGWTKGAFRSFIGPIAFIFFSLIAVINYDLNQNLVKSLAIVAIGTSVTMIIVWILWTLSRRAVPAEERYFLFWGSRLVGGIVTLAWRGIILALILIFITILPTSMVGQRAKQIIKESRTYAAIHIYLTDFLPYMEKTSRFVEVFASPSWSEPIQDTSAYQGFVENEKIQSLLNDPETMEQIQNKDIVQVLSNPKVTSILTDEELMQEFTALVKLAVKERQRQEEEKPAESP